MSDAEQNSHEPTIAAPGAATSSAPAMGAPAPNAPASGVAASEVSGLGAPGVPTVGGAPDAGQTADASRALNASRAPADAAPKPCDECGGAMIAVDVAGGDERPALIRDNFGRFFSRDSLVYIERAHGCTRCGHVRLFVDPVKLRKRAAPKTSVCTNALKPSE